VGVGVVTQEVSARWSNLTQEQRIPYEELAGKDKERYRRESALRDEEVMREQARRRAENNSNSGGNAVLKEGSKRAANQAAVKEYERRMAAAEERKAHYKARAPSKKQMEFRQKAQREKEDREMYIEKKRSQVRKDRAKQAKRRLEYLLKQSNIFCHFGEVKEDDESRFLSSNAAVGSSASRRHNGGGGDKEAVVDAEEDVEAIDAEEATFLTSQPSTLGFGKMRPYQLEGLNWMIRLQEHGVNGILAGQYDMGVGVKC